jgi:hypothetical protein
MHRASVRLRAVWRSNSDSCRTFTTLARMQSLHSVNNTLVASGSFHAVERVMRRSCPHWPCSNLAKRMLAGLFNPVLDHPSIDLYIHVNRKYKCRYA